MTKTELKIRIDMHRRELNGLESIEVGCRTCEHYAMPECDKWNAAPPPDIVASGCDEWTYDFIPF
jgi:hypothetical protein